jgi:hypothetical protein
MLAFNIVTDQVVQLGQGNRIALKPGSNLAGLN